MAKKQATTKNPRLEALCQVLDERAGLYRELRGAKDFGSYLETAGTGADEEILTEPVLAEIIERVLGFPKDAYFPQRGKGGLKPDFTPMDVIAHPFVFDAKGSEQSLPKHEEQIRRYMRQRSLDYGVLFNLRECRVYASSTGRGHDATLSFALLPLWREARGESMPTGELEALERFCAAFGHRDMDTADQIDHVRTREAWAGRLAQGEPVEVDVEFLVQQLRVLSSRLADDAGAQRDVLEDAFLLNPDRRAKVLEELRALANDIAPGTDPADLPATVEGWIGAGGLAGRAWRQFLVRVAYLALTRILLYRAWEDVDFADSFLYDGGFNDAYDRLAQDVRRVLDEAFMHGAELYRWIYGEESNYQWYRPREAALVETLYRLSPFPLGKLDADVLGGLYQTYVEEIDRDRLGQFFTPRSVVRFMLDRAGFAGPEGVFEIEGDRRKPKRVLDFATGSGGFLVEAARRVIDDAGIDLDDARAVKEALAAISTGFYGSEISPFPYYLSEINLLLQVSRLLGRLRIAGERPQAFTLGILHADTLESRGMPAASLEQLDAGHRGDRLHLDGDDRWDLGLALTGAKQDRYRDLRPGGRLLRRIVTDPWKDGPVEIDQAALLGELPAKDKVSVRIDSSLSLTGPGTRGKPVREGKKTLVLRRGQAETGRVEGDPARLDLLARLLGGRATDDLGAVLLPKDLDAFERLAAERAKTVRALLAEGRELVERVERLVCALYDVPDDLTDEVVAHAGERANRSA